MRCNSNSRRKEIMKQMLSLLVAVLMVFSVCGAWAGEKPHVAVMDLEARGVEENVALSLSDYLRMTIFQSGKFVVVNREDMKSILKEQGFQLAGCRSAACAVEMGQLLGAEKMFMGSVGKIGSSYMVTVKLISVETSATEKMEGESGIKSEDDLPAAVDKIVARMMGVDVGSQRSKVESQKSEKAAAARRLVFLDGRGNWLEVNGEMTREGKPGPIECVAAGEPLQVELDDISYLNVLTRTAYFKNGHSASFEADLWTISYFEEAVSAGFKRKMMRRFALVDTRLVVLEAKKRKQAEKELKKAMKDMPRAAVLDFNAGGRRGLSRKKTQSAAHALRQALVRQGGMIVLPGKEVSGVKPEEACEKLGVQLLVWGGVVARPGGKYTVSFDYRNCATGVSRGGSIRDTDDIGAAAEKIAIGIAEHWQE